MMREPLSVSGENMLLNPYMLNFDFRHASESEKYKLYMSVTKVIRELLRDCRINSCSKGYSYIQDCILAIIDQRDLNINFNNDVYPYVALKYGITDIRAIEHSIRNAILAAYRLYESDEENRSSIMDHFERRPTNKMFVLHLTREVYRKLWDESVELLTV